MSQSPGANKEGCDSGEDVTPIARRAGGWVGPTYNSAPILLGQGQSPKWVGDLEERFAEEVRKLADPCLSHHQNKGSVWEFVVMGVVQM